MPIDKGSLEALFVPFDGDPLQPVVQCIHIKPFPTNDGRASDRFRIVFSDTVHFVQGMLATQANFHIHGGKLRKGCILKMTKYNASNVKGKRYDIVWSI